MKAASLKDLKIELSSLPSAQLVELCLQLVKYKKDNKELLTYLLFESSDEQLYISEVKEQIDELFAAINPTSLYLAKKSLRKTLNFTVKSIKYSGQKQTEVDLLLYFCIKLRKSGIPLHDNTALGNIYQRQIQKIKKTLEGLHEDLQHDYAEELLQLN